MKQGWGKTPITDARLDDIRRQYRYKCRCGWETTIYPFEKVDKKLCKNCGNYVYINKEKEFKDRLKEKMK